MNYSYIIIDDDLKNVVETKAIADSFPELIFLSSATNYADGLSLILTLTPDLIFLEIDPIDLNSELSFLIINELHRYLNVMPKIIITTKKKDFAFEAIQFQVTDYLIKPVQNIDLVKLLLRLNKSVAEQSVYLNRNQSIESTSIIQQQLPNVGLNKNNATEKPLVLCIKSYGDYRYIDAKEIRYLQADNNSTDIYLITGEIITAFKTLKHFEQVLPFPFSRIHNSYMVNRNCISRIHTGNAMCYLKNTATKIPFSKSYKKNIDCIISDLACGNYLEI